MSESNLPLQAFIYKKSLSNTATAIYGNKFSLATVI